MLTLFELKRQEIEAKAKLLYMAEASNLTELQQCLRALFEIQQEIGLMKSEV